MADGGVTSKHSKTKWILLSKIKSTVHVLLENRNSNIWSTYGGLNRIIDDLERIFRHNLKSHKDFFGKPIDYDVVLKNAGILGGNYTGKIWLKETLTQHTFMSQLTYIIENKPLIKEFYQDTAFLRSPDYCKALLICIEAVETNSPGIITQLNDIVVQKDRIYGQDMERESFQDNHIPKTMDNEISYETEKSPKNIQELPETERPLLTTNYNGEQDEKTSDIKGFIAVEERLSAEEEECCDGGDLEIEETPVATNGANTMTTLNTDLLKNHDIHLAKEKLQIKELKLATSKKRKHNIDQGTLAQVALTAVMEGDERCVSPSSCWFEGTSTCSQRKQSTSLSDSDLKDLQKEDDVDSTSKIQDNKRTSQHSLDSFMDSKLQINCLNSKQTSNSQHSLDSIIPSRLDYKSMKAHGHSRSRSDGTRLIKNTVRQHSMMEMPSHKKQHTKSITENSSRLSSSLPEKESSVEFYHNDPLSPHEEVTSYASMLALQDLSSCELEKENAHFSISEALIQAIEQMKCDQIIASEDDEEDDDDDEEIQHLKQEIERRRLEKKREKLRLEGAFSDETPKSASNQSSTSDHSTRSSSSKSSCVDIDDIDPDWEQISQEHVHNLSNLSASETTLVPEIHPAVLDVSSMESSASPPLSAEAVAKSLLQKFANKKHPAASELQWLVSENDVPQSLLPLPKAFSVDPEEGIRNVDDGRKTLPCRMRGNLEWAPPRFQIIFHIPPQPRRRQLMAEQNYRCVGCGMQVDPGYMKRFRYCHYLGKYACSSCHNNALMIIPARVIRQWEFKKYEVSKFACDLLNKIHADPLFNIQDLNRSLYDKVRILEIMKNLRKQLYFLRSFAQTCRKSQHLQIEFSHIPDHLLSEEHLYSLQDLIQVKSGELPTYFKSLVSQCLQHIGECPLCQAKGFICEYCRNGDDIIFPYELDRVIQCKNCRASFHKDCYVEGKCPKCERIQIRKSLMAASLPPEA